MSRLGRAGTFDEVSVTLLPSLPIASLTLVSPSPSSTMFPVTVDTFSLLELK